jgi:hypothetical protein
VGVTRCVVVTTACAGRRGRAARASRGAGPGFGRVERMPDVPRQAEPEPQIAPQQAETAPALKKRYPPSPSSLPSFRLSTTPAPHRLCSTGQIGVVTNQPRRSQSARSTSGGTGRSAQRSSSRPRAPGTRSCSSRWRASTSSLPVPTATSSGDTVSSRPSPPCKVGELPDPRFPTQRMVIPDGLHIRTKCPLPTCGSPAHPPSSYSSFWASADSDAGGLWEHHEAARTTEADLRNTVLVLLASVLGEPVETLQHFFAEELIQQVAEL